MSKPTKVSSTRAALLSILSGLVSRMPADQNSVPLDEQGAYKNVVALGFKLDRRTLCFYHDANLVSELGASVVLGVHLGIITKPMAHRIMRFATRAADKALNFSAKPPAADKITVNMPGIGRA